MRTREPGAPSESPDSIRTAVIGLFAVAATELARPSDPTLRKSRSTVRASGRVATYGTGTLVSISSDAPLLLTGEEIAVSRGAAAADESASPDARTSTPASVTDTKRARPFVTVIP